LAFTLYLLSQDLKNSNGSQDTASMESWLLSKKILTRSQAELAKREGLRLGHSFSEELAEYRSVRGHLSKASDFIGHGPSNDGHLSLRRLVLDDELRSKLPPGICQSLAVIPLAEKDGALWVASANPFDLPTHKRIEAAAGQPVETLPASETDIRLAINRNYSETDALYEAVGAFIEMDAAQLNEQG
jgi:hypothetical protein